MTQTIFFHKKGAAAAVDLNKHDWT
jgi:hypothetical protein